MTDNDQHQGRREPDIYLRRGALYSACTPDPPRVGKQAARLLAGDAQLSDLVGLLLTTDSLDLQLLSVKEGVQPRVRCWRWCRREPLLLAAVRIGGEHNVPAECEDHDQQ